MADVKISQLPAASDGDIDGNVVVPGVAAGATAQVTLDQISNYVSTDLDLGTAATYDVGAGGVAIPLLSEENTWSQAQTVTGGFRLRASQVSGDPEGLVTSDSNGDIVFTANNHLSGVEFRFEANGDFSVPGTIDFGTPIAVSAGGTGADNASDARTNLGLGTAATRTVGAASGAQIPDRDAADARYLQIGGDGIVPVGGADGQVLTKQSGTDYDYAWEDPGAASGTLPTGGTTGQYLRKASATNYDAAWDTLTTADVTDLTAAGISVVTAANASAQRTAIGVVIGTDVQAQNANLSAFGGLTLVADRLPYANGSGTLALATFTAAGRALVDDADASAQRTTLGLGSLATLSAVNDSNWSGTDLAVTNGGTGASDASGARTNLGLTEASNSEVWSGTDSVKVITANRLFGSAAPVTLTQASTIAVDMNTLINATTTMTGNRTLGNPTNAKVGQSGVIIIKQDATGNRTLAYQSSWKFAGGAPVLSTAANSIDVISYFVADSTPTILCTMSKAFA